LEEWKNDLNREIDSIHRILPNARAGEWDDNYEDEEHGEKARALRTWIRSVLRKIIHYQVEHQRLLIEAATTVQLVLPQDIVFNSNSVLYFLELPSHIFGEENHQVDAGDVGEQEGHEVERGNHLDDLNGDDDELEETYQEHSPRGCRIS